MALDASFDPDAPAQGDGIYGLPSSPEESAVILIPVPWEATVSYGGGTALGPSAILEASRQVDLYDHETGRPYEQGIALLPAPREVVEWNTLARVPATGNPSAPEEQAARIRLLDELGERLNTLVYNLSSSWLDRGRLVGVIGGEHSCPFGHLRAVAERFPGMGVLQVDAHMDLREAYEGFRWSHASIFWNVYHRISSVSRIVQVGIRDSAAREEALARDSGGRVRVFHEADLRRRMQEGEPWIRLAREVVDSLPAEVYLSFDIDGLDPSLCPHTGTPVPGGLSFDQATSLFRLLVESGRRIVGFDLCEVAPEPGGAGQWDGNVGARLLYKMIGFARMSVAAGGGI